MQKWRLHHFQGLRVRSVDRNVNMIVLRIMVQPINGLVPYKPHAFQKNIHQLIHLGAGGLFMLLP